MAERTTRPRTSRGRDPQPRTPRGGLSLARMMPLLVAAGVLVVVGLALMALAVKSSGRPTAEAADASARRSPTKVIASAGSVEVPAVAGGALADAQLVLDAAGFKISVSYEEQAAGRPGTVLGQDPAPGVLVPSGSQIRLVVAGNNAGTRSPTATTLAASVAAKPKQFVVVIDPGHQARSDQGREPVGPGSGVRKVKSTGGATGVSTHVPEYEIALQISTNLAARLRKAGVKVVMTRTTNDVNLSNAERAMLANRSQADLFVRIHGNASPDPNQAGASTLYPAANRWARPYSMTSKQAALRVQSGVLSATGAQDNGVEPRGDLAGFNFAKVPSVLVECGFLSNPVEDRLLGSPHYQDKVAQGIADGVLAYLEHTR
jgi:N-acetylmuramoyl-L-alanine amidase